MRIASKSGGYPHRRNGRAWLSADVPIFILGISPKPLRTLHRSGDYDKYAQVETVAGVTLRGESDRFSLAVWTSDGYSYSISVSEAPPQPDMMALVSGVK